jgi:hypothetical protein
MRLDRLLVLVHQCISQNAFGLELIDEGKPDAANSELFRI